ncbi:Lrp/AsnC family transcriptional regulator [Leifsonia sp. YAF41]|uniref:Lrp/AsnC family transcriptional regulator n=1 Tax=Leifsonia sp. YAF41 TaxID=3233086 RepID=UPI003F9D233A
MMQTSADFDVTEEDLALIHGLQIAPRASWSDAARVLDSHPTTLAARFGRLRDAGCAWVTTHLIGTPSQRCLSFIDIECELSRRDAVIAAVCAIPEVVSVDVSARNRDLLLTVLTPSMAGLSDQIFPLLSRIDGLTRYQTSVCTALHVSGDAWRLNALDKTQIAGFRALAPLTTATPPVELSPPAWPITEILARDGRATAADIARETGMHPATARRQLGRMLASRAVSFRTEIAQPISGLPLTCQWFAKVPAGQHELAAEAIRSLPNVRLCASTTGPTNFIIVMWLTGIAEVMPTERLIVEKIPGIELTESAIALNIVKRVGWMLRPDGTSTGTVVTPRPPTSGLASYTI